jgi:hypothetical protein
MFITIVTKYIICFYNCNSSIFLETKGRHANAKAQEAVDHLASFSSSREEISQPGVEPPTSCLGFWYLSTIIQ